MVQGKNIDCSDASNPEVCIIFDVTENMSNIGIINFTLNAYDFEFTLKNRKLCVPFSPKDSSISKHSKNIEKKLWHGLENSITETPKVFYHAITDIESQLIERRDEIFDLNNKASKEINKLDPIRAKFFEEVETLKHQYKAQNITYNQWQSNIAEKYSNLKKITLKHYPEAWAFLEFSLAIKSILNIEDFSLPFMGVILAAPASMKTMIIQLFRKYPYSFYTDSFTPNSLVSHNSALSEEQLQQIDMFPKMKDKLILTPELAPIFTAKDDDLQKLLGIITRILDGHGLENDSGAHGHRKYGDTMFVWLGAAVEIPPRVWKLLGTLGHKIYFLRPPLHKKTPEELKKMAKSNNYSSNNKEIEAALLEYLKTFDAGPETENKLRVDENGLIKIRWNELVEGDQDKAIGYIAQVANLLAPLRGTVYLSESNSASYKQKNNNANSESNLHCENKNNILIQIDGKDYDTDFPIIEDPSRATILLRNIAIGLAISQGRDSINLTDVPIAIKVALSTAPIRRVKVLDLLLAKGGEVTTSEITAELKVSQPISRRTMREFYALGIAELSAIAGYENAEFKITLKSDYDWFKTKDFEKLKEGFVPTDYNKEEDNGANSFTDKERPSCYNLTCHMQITESPPETHMNNYESATSKFPHEQNNNNARLSDNRSNEKDIVSLRGGNSFHHVTQSQSPMILSNSNDSDEEEEAILEQILNTIRDTNGSTLSVNSTIESVYRSSPEVRAFLGDKLTSRSNRKVRDLFLKIIRHKNIEVVKYRPQLLVKWSGVDQVVSTQ